MFALEVVSECTCERIRYILEAEGRDLAGGDVLVLENVLGDGKLAVDGQDGMCLQLYLDLRSRCSRSTQYWSEAVSLPPPPIMRPLPLDSRMLAPLRLTKGIAHAETN